MFWWNWTTDFLSSQKAIESLTRRFRVLNLNEYLTCTNESVQFPKWSKWKLNPKGEIFGTNSFEYDPKMKPLFYNLLGISWKSFKFNLTLEELVKEIFTEQTKSQRKYSTSTRYTMKNIDNNNLNLNIAWITEDLVQKELRNKKKYLIYLQDLGDNPKFSIRVSKRWKILWREHQEHFETGHFWLVLVDW